MPPVNEPFDFRDRLAYQMQYGEPKGTFDTELNAICEAFFTQEIDEVFLYHDSIFFRVGDTHLKVKVEWICTTVSCVGHLIPNAKYSLVTDLRSIEDREKDSYLASMSAGTNGSGKITYESNGLIPRYKVISVIMDALRKTKGNYSSFWTEKTIVYRKAKKLEDIITDIQGERE